LLSIYRNLQETVTLCPPHDGVLKVVNMCTRYKVVGFLLILRFRPPIKWPPHNISQILLKVDHPKIISTQISEQKILMWFLSNNIPKWYKLAEKISQKNPEYMFQIKANLAGMVLGWSPFKIVSDSLVLHSKWLLLLKIEISLVVNFHFITNQEYKLIYSLSCSCS
jgi:hypothetical protein